MKKDNIINFKPTGKPLKSKTFKDTEIIHFRSTKALSDIDYDLGPTFCTQAYWPYFALEYPPKAL